MYYFTSDKQSQFDVQVYYTCTYLTPIKSEHFNFILFKTSCVQWRM